MRPPFSVSEYGSWTRHSICSLEGDILVSNIESPVRGNEEYLIPSLLLLKQKVDRVFGSQPIVSLSQDRKGVTVDVCGDSVGKEQFRIFAESVVKKTGAPSVSDVSSIEGNLVLSPTPPIPLQPIPPASIQSSSLPTHSSSSPYTPSFTSLSLSTVTQPFPLLPSPSLIRQSTIHHRLHFIITPPSHSLLDSLLAKYNQPPCFYDTLGISREFDCTSYLESLGLIQPSQKYYQNRIVFWKELLSQQISLPSNRVFRRYRYSYPPPRLSINNETSIIGESLDIKKTPSQFCSFHSLTQSSSTQTQSHSYDKPELRLFNLELICENEIDKKPNPRSDQIIAVFYSYSISYEFGTRLIYRDQHNNDSTVIHSGFIFSLFLFPSVI